MTRGYGKGSAVRPGKCEACGIEEGGTVEAEQVKEEEEKEAGGRRKNKLGDPVMRQEKEVSEHERTHFQFRS